MTDAIVFNGANTLDFFNVRSNVVRIPEVMARLSQAQDLWDRNKSESFNFYNFIVSEDRTFLSSLKLKALCSAVVQIGLYDRYIKKFGPSSLVIGAINGDSALRTIVGEQSFAELVLGESVASTVASGPRAHLKLAEEPVLSGVSLTEYQVFRAADDELGEVSFVRTDYSDMEVTRLVTKLVTDENVNRFVNIGPGSLLLDRAQQELALYDIQMLESIDLDPMLNWFWSEVKRPAYVQEDEYAAAAQ
ncbi:MAG: hypothetical protein KDD59_09350 [Bdellovibrionales bacterium]|nr:hypothetical protein [Bdellovibrionales bacterium]